MPVNLQDIVNAAADEADDFLRGVTSIGEAKTVIAEWLADHHPRLSQPERQKIAQGLLAILDREGFFESTGFGDSWEGGETGEVGQ